MKNKKFSFKKFVNNEKVQFTFLAILSIVILLLSVFAPKWLKNRSNVLKSGNNTQLVEKKSRIVNDNEIWSDNISTGIINVGGIANEIFILDDNDNNSFYYNYATTRDDGFTIYLNSDYNNVRVTLYTENQINNLSNIYCSNSSFSNIQFMAYYGEYYHYHIYTVFINSPCSVLRCNLNNGAYYDGDMKLMISSSTNMYYEYQPYGQIGYTKQYFDETTENLIQNNKGVSLFERFTGVGYYNSQDNLTITDLTSVNDVLDDNKQFFADSYLTRYSQAQSVYLEYLATSQFALRVSDGITFEVNPSISKIYFVINAYDRLENLRNSYYIEFVNPNINNGLTNSIEFDSLIRNSIAKDNQDNYVYMYSTLENGEYRYDYSYDEYTGIKSMRVFISLLNRTNVRINATISQYAEGYNNGYKQGSQEGYNNGQKVILNNPHQFDLKTNLEYINYGETRYQDGIRENYSLTNEVGGLINMPFTFAKDALGWDFFGINLYELFASALGVLLIIWILKKFLK